MSEIVIAVYRAHSGQEAQLKELLEKHVKLLRSEKLVTDRPALLLQSKMSSRDVVEIFEWVSAEATEAAHHNTRVQEIWQKMGEIAEFLPLASLKEAGTSFPHFARY